MEIVKAVSARHIIVNCRRSKTKRRSSVQFSRSVVSDSPRPHGLQHARPPCPSPTPRVYSHSCLLSQWCHPTISSSVIPFSSCPQSFTALGSFTMSQFFATWPKYWSFSFNISPSNEYTGLISFRMDWLDSLQSKGLSRVFIKERSVYDLMKWLWCKIREGKNIYL